MIKGAKWLTAALPPVVARLLAPVVQAGLTAGLLAVGLPQECVAAVDGLLRASFGW